MTAETPSEVRSLVAIRLLESAHRAEAITVLRELIATEAQEAPKSVQALLAINEIADIDWELLYDTALIGDDDSAPQAIVALLQAGQLGMAVPAALHLLAVYPPKTIARREVRLWAVVEALIEQGQMEIAQQRDRHVTRSKELQYEHFWGEKAIGAVEGMVTAVEREG